MLLTLLSVMILTSCGDMSGTDETSADLVVVNARIWTADSANPWADALAVRGETLAFV
ncbi:MAG TPA: hypothetical protein VIL33_01780 [Rhodothermia bacterium]